jgi:glyoxylase I family protein
VAKWYQEHLRVTLTPSSYEQAPWRQHSGPTAFSPIPEPSPYFEDRKRGWMVNFRDRDLDAVRAQLGAAGVAIAVDPEHCPNNRFARLHDPEGNPIELRQPAGRAVTQ